MIDTTDAFERNNEGYLVHPTLYKLDSKGKLRTWAMQRDGSRYRTLAGLADGKQAVSDWTQAVAASQDTDEDQAIFEVKAKYKHQLDREYHDNADSVSQPKMIEPMLAKSYSKWPGPGCAQPKLDGIRCIMTAQGMFSRQGQPLTGAPHLHEAAKPLFETYPDLVLDGELYNHDLRDDFGAISSIVRKKNPTLEQLAKSEEVMQYYVYDTVDTNSDFLQRSVFLGYELTKLANPLIVLVPTHTVHTEEQADELYEQHIAQGFEGGMYRLDKPYQLGKRSSFLLKRKDFITEEFKLLKLEEGQGNWAGAAKRAVLQKEDGTVFGAGLRGKYGAGKALLDLILTEDAVATLRYFQLTPDGVPRFGVVIDIHPEGRKD